MWVWKVWVGPFFPHQFLVDNHGEMEIQDAVVVDGQAQDQSNESVLSFILQGGWIKPKDSCLIIVGEHSCAENVCKKTLNTQTYDRDQNERIILWQQTVL